MMRHYFIFTIFLISSCATKKKEIQPLRDDQLSCIRIEREPIIYHPESIIGLYYLTNEKDTLFPTELFFSDSSRFTQSFKDIKVPEKCIYMALEGKTYYSIQINDTGGFSDF